MAQLMVFALRFDDLESFNRMTRRSGFVKSLRDMAKAYCVNDRFGALCHRGHVLGIAVDARHSIFCVEGSLTPVRNDTVLQPEYVSSRFGQKERALLEFHNHQVKKRVSACKNSNKQPGGSLTEAADRRAQRKVAVLEQHLMEATSPFDYNEFRVQLAAAEQERVLIREALRQETTPPPQRQHDFMVLPRAGEPGAAFTAEPFSEAGALVLENGSPTNSNE